jgi:hypothetical protein
MTTKYKDIDTIYRRYSLPDKKSIRNAIFKTPALLFYAEELATLPFCNVDILLQILKSDDILISFQASLFTWNKRLSCSYDLRKG